MFNPLLFADWSAISRGLTIVSWLVVLVLAIVIAGHLSPSGTIHHTLGHVAAVR
jgi:hypothetical protein